MAAKTKEISGSYTGTPAVSELVGNSYATQNDDRAAIIEVIQEEHYLVPGTNSDAHGRHLAGSAIAYVGSSAPTLEPDAATLLSSSSANNGRLWLDTTNVTYPVLKEYVHGTGWVELFKLNIDTTPQGASPTLAVTALSGILDQAVKIASAVKFASVVAATFTGRLVGAADKIRTDAPSSPADGDIWIA
jgi:hypothetical protein